MSKTKTKTLTISVPYYRPRTADEQAVMDAAKAATQEEIERGERGDLDTPYLPPLSLPNGWMMFQKSTNGAAFADRRTKLHVIVSEARERDGRAWRHVSLSYQGRLPSHDDVARVKALFIGENKTALQVYPSKDQHVNYMPFCLHLWHCLDGDVTPDFRTGGMV